MSARLQLTINIKMNNRLSHNLFQPIRPLEEIETFVRQDANGATAKFGELTMRSAFQPVLSIVHRRPVGYEALLRAYDPDGRPVSPLKVFEQAAGEQEGIFLDRLCRNLHLRNFLGMANETDWLFLNINPQVIVRGGYYGSYFSELLQRFDVPPHRIVLEILEGKILDEAVLAKAVGHYRELGCLVAIDDFGAGHSNFERIWRIAPDIVKLDRSIIVQAIENRRVRRVIPNLVSLIHESGSLALMEGIETEEQTMIAVDSGIDFVQGYFFGRPCAQLPPPAHDGGGLSTLCDKFLKVAEGESARHRESLLGYVDTFKDAAKRVASGIAPEQACAEFLSRPRTERCYLLDGTGRQLGDNLPAHGRPGVTHSRFAPLADASGAVWSRRPYFRRAMSRPGEVQISRPYLSITGANMCVTLSVTVTPGGQLQVLCCDLDWNDL